MITAVPQQTMQFEFRVPGNPQDKWLHIMLIFDSGLLFSSHFCDRGTFYPKKRRRKRCPSCNRHFLPEAKVSIKKSLSSPPRETRIWFQSDVALLRRECNVFNLVSEEKKQKKTTHFFCHLQFKNISWKCCWHDQIYLLVLYKSKDNVLD